MNEEYTSCKLSTEDNVFSEKKSEICYRTYQFEDSDDLDYGDSDDDAEEIETIKGEGNKNMKFLTNVPFMLYQQYLLLITL